MPGRDRPPGRGAGQDGARRAVRLRGARACPPGRHLVGDPRRLDLRPGPDGGHRRPVRRPARPARERAMTSVFLDTPKRLVDVTVDGQTVRVPEGATLLDACRQEGIDTPTLCYLENLTPVNVCRVCVVEVDGSRALVPACSRKAEPGMTVHTDSERVRTSRKMVLEFLASSADLSLASPEVHGWMTRYEVDPGRYGPPAPDQAAGQRDATRPGEHHATDGSAAATVGQPVKYDNDSYVRDYSRCILCYKCVEACGEDAQNTFAKIGRAHV